MPEARMPEANKEDQKISFAAICSCREEPRSPIGKRVAVIRPKLVEPAVAVTPGLLKLGWLATSKASARSWRLRVSKRRVFFSSDTSTSAKPGPRRALRDRLPSALLAGIWKVQPGAVVATVHTELVNHCTPVALVRALG